MISDIDGLFSYITLTIHLICLSKVYGALRMSVKMFLMWNSKMLIECGEDITVATSLLEASNLIVLRVCNNSSLMHYIPFVTRYM